MRSVKVFFNIFLLFSFFLFIFQSQIQASTYSISTIAHIQENRVSDETLRKIEKINNTENLFDLKIEDLITFDELFELMESFQDLDEVMANYTFEEIQSIAFFFIKMTRIGVAPENEEKLERDIEELLSAFEDIADSMLEKEDKAENYSFASPIYDNTYVIASSDYTNEMNVIFCGKISKACKKTKKGTKKIAKKTADAVAKAGKEIVKFAVSASEKTIDFVAEHPTETAIAAALITAGIVTFVACSPDEEEDVPLPSQSSSDTVEGMNPENIPNTLLTTNETSQLTETIEGHLDSLKEKIQAEELISSSNAIEQSELSSSLWEKTNETIRDHSAYLAHKFLDEVSDYVKIFPECVEEFANLFHQIVPEELVIDIVQNNLIIDSGNGAVEKYEEKVFEAHKQIDQLFATNLSDQYTKEAKEFRDNQFTQAILPPPSILLNNTKALKNLAEAGKTPDKGGLTKAGRALAKHGGRKGSVFPKPTGTPMQINQQGQEILENILNHPNKKNSSLYFQAIW